MFSDYETGCRYLAVAIDAGRVVDALTAFAATGTKDAAILDALRRAVALLFSDGGSDGHRSIPTHEQIEILEAVGGLSSRRSLARILNDVAGDIGDPGAGRGEASDAVSFFSAVESRALSSLPPSTSISGWPDTRHLTPLEALLHKASDLSGFVRKIALYPDDPNGTRARGAGSNEFFDYILELSRGTIEYLDGFPKVQAGMVQAGLMHSGEDTEPAKLVLCTAFRQRLRLIRTLWIFLHPFFKAAGDADDRHVPVALMGALARRVNGVPGLESARFAAFHAGKINDLFVNTSDIRRLGEGLSHLIPDAPPFPDNLGVVGILWSQNTSDLMNTLIARETGHHVFDHAVPAIAEAIEPDIRQCLERSRGTLGELAWSADRLRAWARELFCDLWATWAIGPFYLFAYIDTFDLPRILTADGREMHLECAFSTAAPSHVFRLQQQVIWLKTLGWWDRVSAVRSHYVEVLEAASTVPESAFRFVDSDHSIAAAEALADFFPIAEKIAGIIRALVDADSSAAANLESIETDLAGYLAKGIVMGMRESDQKRG